MSAGTSSRFLLGRGERMKPVPPKLMAGTRRSAPTRGKSDPIDARAVAQRALVPPGHVAVSRGSIRPGA
jgi:hypothetical protein